MGDGHRRAERRAAICWRRQRHDRESVMTLTDSKDDEASVEECLEELDELLATLARFAPQVLAAAIATHLEALLAGLFAAGECSAAEVRELLRELERGALER
jgi:hypothetical protein